MFDGQFAKPLFHQTAFCFLYLDRTIKLQQLDGRDAWMLCLALYFAQAFPIYQLGSSHKGAHSITTTRKQFFCPTAGFSTTPFSAPR